MRRVGAPVAGARIAVVIPCYKVSAAIVPLLKRIGPEVERIYCVDDACPDGTGKHIEKHFGDSDPRIVVVYRQNNGGVGAATCDGYRAAIADRCDIIIKIDGDGQMDPLLIPDFAAPIASGEADYVKGNRFFSLETVHQMSWRRIIGNAGLSFLAKLSSGYWNLFDPTNGYTAIEARVAGELPLAKLHPRFFFESDILFRLNTLRARIVELPLVGLYGNEKSNLSEGRALLTHPVLHARNFCKRIAYTYFLRGFSLASMNLLVGLILLTFGLWYGAWQWSIAKEAAVFASAGTVMLSALPILSGIQLLLSFFSHDMSMTPSEPVHGRITRVRPLTQLASDTSPHASGGNVAGVLEEVSAKQRDEAGS